MYDVISEQLLEETCRDSTFFGANYTHIVTLAWIIILKYYDMKKVHKMIFNYKLKWWNFLFFSVDNVLDYESEQYHCDEQTGQGDNHIDSTCSMTYNKSGDCIYN